MLEGMRRVLLCMLEAVEGERSLLKASEVMHRVLLCTLVGCGGWTLFAGGVGGVGGAGGDTPCASLYAGGHGG